MEFLEIQQRKFRLHLLETDKNLYQSLGNYDMSMKLGEQIVLLRQEISALERETSMSYHVRPYFSEPMQPQKSSNDKGHNIFREAPNVTTTINISIDAFTAKLVFQLMEEDWGREMLTQIAAKALPEESTLLDECELQSVTGQGNAVRFEFVTEGQMLNVPNPAASFKLHEDFKVTPEQMMKAVEQKETPSSYTFTQEPDWDAVRKSINENLTVSPYGIFSTGIMTNSLVMPYLSPSTTPITGTFSHVTPTNLAKLLSDTEKTNPSFPGPQETTHAPAFALLIAPRTAITDETYRIYRTDLDTYQVYEEDDESAPLFVSGGGNLEDNKEELKDFFKYRADDYFNSALENHQDPRFPHALSDAIWKRADY